jgi:DNA-binding transcriptional regulator YiaG
MRKFMKRKYQSEMLMVCHQEAENLLAVGAISEAEMREYDEMCLVQEPDQAPTSTPGTRQAPAYTSPR